LVNPPAPQTKATISDLGFCDMSSSRRAPLRVPLRIRSSGCCWRRAGRRWSRTGPSSSPAQPDRDRKAHRCPTVRAALPPLQRPTALIPFPAGALRSQSVLDGRTPASPAASCPAACPSRFAGPTPSASQGQAPSTAGLPLQLPGPRATATSTSEQTASTCRRDLKTRSSAFWC
jgi:hypothetical protein